VSHRDVYSRKVHLDSEQIAAHCRSKSSPKPHCQETSQDLHRSCLRVGDRSALLGNCPL